MIKEELVDRICSSCSKREGCVYLLDNEQWNCPKIDDRLYGEDFSSCDYQDDCCDNDCEEDDDE